MRVSRPTIIAGAFVVAIAVMAYASSSFWLRPEPAPSADSGPMVAVTVPKQLSDAATQGRALFEDNCLACHGANAAGSDSGPPLVHRIYEPNHHADMAFLLAAKRGVRGHHWDFGDMPPVENITDEQVAAIVVYVRELQRANGIN